MFGFLSRILKVWILAFKVASLHIYTLDIDLLSLHSAEWNCIQQYRTHVFDKRSCVSGIINWTWRTFESPLTFLTLHPVLYCKPTRDWLAPSQNTLWFVSSLWKFVVNFAFCFFFSTLSHCSLPLCLEVSCSKKKRYYFPVETNPDPLMKRTIHNVGLELI